MADRFYQVRFEYTAKGQPCVASTHVFGNDVFVDFTPLTAQGLADGFAGHTALINAWASLLNTTDHVTGVTVRELLAPGITTVPDTGFSALAVAGTRSLGAGLLPLPVCGMLQMKSSAAVRGGQSWMHLPPIRAEGALDVGGSIASGSFYDTNSATLISELNHWKQGGSKWSGSNWGLGNYARKRRAFGYTQFAFHVTSILRSPTTHYLRSRRDGQAV